MPYYTAVIAHRGDGWELLPTDLDEVDDLDELTDAVRAATRGDDGLAVLEREDEWFALVRVEGDEDPRVFLSDLVAAREGPQAELFVDVDPPGPLSPGGAAGGAAASGALGPGESPAVSVRAGQVSGPGATASFSPLTGETWGGDPTLLDDHGVGGDELPHIVETSSDPAAALVEIAAKAGFEDLVEAWH